MIFGPQLKVLETQRNNQAMNSSLLWLISIHFDIFVMWQYYRNYIVIETLPRAYIDRVPYFHQ